MGWLDLFRKPNPQPAVQNQQQATPRPKGGLLDWLRSALGGWPGPQNARDTPAEAALEFEKISAGPPGIVLPWFLPFFDDRTGETQQMRHAYRRMIAEVNVKAALLGKLFGVASLDLQIVPASKSTRDGEIAAFVEYALTERLQGGIPQLVWSILSGGLVDGYSICEKVWEPEEDGDYAGKILLDDVKAKQVDDDVILEIDDKRNVIAIRGMRYNAGESFDPRNFIVYKHLSWYSAPSGMSDLRAAYRPYVLLDTAEKLRGIAIEKRAIPLMIAHYAKSDQKPSVDAALAKAKSLTFLSLPKDVAFEALNVAGSADTIFRDACKDWKHDLFLSIQGAILQSLEGTVQDGRGSSKVHKSTADLFKWMLSYQMQQILNREIIRDLVDLNYATGKYPKALLSAVDVNELVQEMAIDTGLSQLGMVLSKEDLYERFGRKPPSSPEDTLHPPPPRGAPPSGPEGPLQQSQDQIKRDTAVEHADTAGSEVAGSSPFRFSERWQRWLRNGCS